MLKPICVSCQRFYRPKKTGFRFTEAAPTDNSAYPGTVEPEMWKPYKLWVGDKWHCDGCGNEIIVGTSLRPVAEQHHDYFETVRINGSYDQFQVNDC